MRQVGLEICIESLESATAAIQGGAGRLEVCSVLGLGGLTPDPGLVEAIRQVSDIPQMVMIRPRHGNFHYSDAELQQMLTSIHRFREMEVHGFVFGCLNEFNEVSVPATSRLIEACQGAQITFHRAFDLVPDPMSSARILLELGAHRILTSGQQQTAWEGRKLIKQLVEASSEVPGILAGGGINPENVGTLIQETGLSEVHGSASRKSSFTNSSQLLPGATLEAGMPTYHTRQEIVASLKEAINETG